MSIWKKIPKWAKWVFPVGLLLLVLILLGRGGRDLWRSFFPPSSRPSRLPSITKKEAEEKREEIREELEAAEDKIETEADALRRKIREKFGELDDS